MRERLARALPWMTGVCVLVQLLSLRLGLLNRFFYDAMHADVQGIDYYSLPKAFLNLASGRSAYDTFGPPPFGPHLTWYLAHPALAVLVGSWFSFVSPETSYGLFTFFSLGCMALCAWLLARLSGDGVTGGLIWLLLMGAFPTYWMLFTGNVQALLVLALGMVFCGLWQLAEGDGGEWFLLGGLVLSLLTKPVVLLMLPLLVLMPETRRAAWRALAAYAGVSGLFELVPALNPESIGLRRVLWLAVHPDYVRGTMNIYSNHFMLTPDMKDNSIHWFNLIAQSEMRLLHMDVFSLPVFVDTLAGKRTPGWIYELPLLAALVLTGLVVRMKVKRQRMEAALLLGMAISLTFFLSYPTVWEYQYTSVLPVAAILLLLWTRGGRRGGLLPWTLGLACCAWLPSLYVLVAGWKLDATTLTVIRLDRVLPVTVLCLLLLFAVGRAVLREGEWN